MHTLVFRNKTQLNQIVTDLSLEKLRLHILLTDVSYSSLKNLVVFCTAEVPEDRSLRNKMVIRSRKSFLEGHKNQLDELLCSCV